MPPFKPYISNDMNYKPSKAGDIFQAFAKLVEAMLFASVIITFVAAVINLFTHNF